MMLPKEVLVTGAASGIGLAVAVALEAQGVRVHGVDRAPRPSGRQGPWHRFDVADAQAWAALRETFAAGNKELGGMVHCAGIGGPAGPLESIGEAALDEVLRINVVGAFSAARFALATMKRGSIVLVASVGGLRGRPFLAPYAASKGAVVQLGRSVALECTARRRPIRCNTLCPGPVATPMLEAALRALPGTREEALDMVLGGVPLGRLAEPEEVAQSALFLLGTDSAYLTGTELVIDGGSIS